MNVIFHRQKTKHVASELRGPGLKNPARHQLRINKSCEKMWTGIKHHKGSNLTLSSHLTSNIFQHELWNWETPQTWEFYLSCFCPKKILRKGSLPIVFPQVVLHWGSHTFPRCFRTGESMMTSSGTIGIPSDHPKPPTKFPFLSGLADQTPSRSIKNQWKTMENPSKQINKNIKRPSNTIKHQSITIKDHQKQSTTNQKNNHTPSRTNGKHIKHQEIQQATTNNAKKKKQFTRWSEKTSECSPCFAMLRSKRGLKFDLRSALFRCGKDWLALGGCITSASIGRELWISPKFHERNLEFHHPKRIEKGWQRCDLPLFWD